VGSSDPELVEVFMALREVVVASQAMRNAFANSLGVSVTDTFAMGHLAGPESRTARDLAEHLGVAQSSVTAVIDRLERAGLAERHAHPTDRRALIVALTDAGRAAVEDIRRWTIKGLDVIVTERRQQLTGDLQSVAEAIHAQIAPYVEAHPVSPRALRKA
jgi:DNA-binding MarR family transcriptional regulator